MKFKKILVTGGVGFIGANFVRHLVDNYSDDCEIVVLDKLTYAGRVESISDLFGYKNNLNFGGKQGIINIFRLFGVTYRGLRFVRGDVCDSQTVAMAMEGCDAVVHFAAESHVDRSIDDSAIFSKTNVLGTHILLEEARGQGVKKFIYVSTDEVYGSIDRGSFRESDLLHPNSPYSASKVGGEQLALSYRRTYGLPVVVTRCVNNFGPYQHPEKFIPRAIISALEGKNIKVYGTGNNVRDWIYVRDHCLMIDRIMRNEEEEVINIGAGHEKTNLEIAKAILKLIPGTKSKIKLVSDRPGHDFRYSVNIDYITAKLSFKASSFEKSLKKTIKWYKNNKKWWKSARKEAEEFYKKIGR